MKKGKAEEKTTTWTTAAMDNRQRIILSIDEESTGGEDRGTGSMRCLF
jgi:hypothetical protein